MKTKKENKVNSKTIVVPRSLWLDVKSMHAWKADLLAPKRNPFSLQSSPLELERPSFTWLLASSTRVCSSLRLGGRLCLLLAEASVENIKWTYHQSYHHKPTKNDSIYFNTLSGRCDYFNWFQEEFLCP